MGLGKPHPTSGAYHHFELHPGSEAPLTFSSGRLSIMNEPARTRKRCEARPPLPRQYDPCQCPHRGPEPITSPATLSRVTWLR
jgi:hypothetical protein